MSTGAVYLLETIKSFRGIKSNAEKALEQLTDAELHFAPNEESNSAMVIMQHLAGNMLSRFTDFLTSDGEKPDRNRDQEFIDHFDSRTALFEYWEKGWKCLLDALQALTENDLEKIVTIRGEEHTVIRALNRQLVHYSYHCGQLIYIAKLIKNKDWKNLSIPRNQSAKYLSTPPPSQTN